MGNFYLFQYSRILKAVKETAFAYLGMINSIKYLSSFLKLLNHSLITKICSNTHVPFMCKAIVYMTKEQEILWARKELTHGNQTQEGVIIAKFLLISTHANQEKIFVENKIFKSTCVVGVFALMVDDVVCFDPSGASQPILQFESLLLQYIALLTISSAHRYQSS